MKITMEGNPVTLNKKPLETGEIAPDFTVIDNEMNPVRLRDFKEKILVLSVVTSIDTGVCSTQTRTFNEKLGNIAGVKVLTISNDLPFAQQRYCATEGLRNAVTLSDYKDLDFATKFGVLMQENRLLARSVFVLDQDRKIIHREIVEEISNEPNYELVLDRITSL